MLATVLRPGSQGDDILLPTTDGCRLWSVYKQICEIEVNVSFSNEVKTGVLHQEHNHGDLKMELFVGHRLLHAPATCLCISGTSLLRQLHMLPH